MSSPNRQTKNDSAIPLKPEADEKSSTARTDPDEDVKSTGEEKKSGKKRKKKKPRIPWTAEEDKHVVELQGKDKEFWSCHFDEQEKKTDVPLVMTKKSRTGGSKSTFSRIATIMTQRTTKQIRERWLNHLAPGLKKGNWTKEDDHVLVVLHEKHGSK